MCLNNIYMSGSYSNATFATFNFSIIKKCFWGMMITTSTKIKLYLDGETLKYRNIELTIFDRLYYFGANDH